MARRRALPDRLAHRCSPRAESTRVRGDSLPMLRQHDSVRMVLVGFHGQVARGGRTVSGCVNSVTAPRTRAHTGCKAAAGSPIAAFGAVPRPVITVVACLAVAAAAVIVLRGGLRGGSRPDTRTERLQSPLLAARVHLLALVGALLVVLAQLTGVLILEARGGYEAELMFTGCPGKLGAVVEQHLARGGQ